MRQTSTMPQKRCVTPDSVAGTFTPRIPFTGWTPPWGSEKVGFQRLFWWEEQLVSFLLQNLQLYLWFFLFALFLQFFTQVSLYPTVVQNKPTNLFTVPAFFPVTFELTILFSGFSILFGLLIWILLPRWNHPLFNSSLFPKSTDDGFLMVIESRDPKFKKDKTRDFLMEIGAGEIEEVSH